MQIKTFDVIIVGAGPAGCAAAYMLSGHGLSIAVVEKSVFPRDKVCGDALSADVSNQFVRMSDQLAKSFEHFPKKLASNGVRFFAPNHQKLDIEFTPPKDRFGGGFIASRLDFDHFFFNQLQNLGDVTIFQQQQIKDVVVTEEKISLTTADLVFEGKIALGADGAHSILNKKLTTNKVEKKHFCAGLRQYYENVQGFHPSNHIELHFYKDLLPGYFWVFPLPNNKANVGLGMLSSEVSKQKLNLKEKLEELIATHPNLKERFKDAQPLETIQGYGLPIGSKKRSISGDRFLLLGDAASLIDPFTGEGIGNAIRSGRVAAEHVLKATKKGAYDASFNKAYDKEIYHKMWNELRLGHSLQMLLKYPRIFNFVVKKANKNKSVQLLLSSMLNNVDIKKELVKPMFYFKLFFS